MILLDANILLYAYHAGSPHHADARAWIEEAFSGTEPVRLPWTTIHAFLRIGTNPRVFEHPLGIDEARSHVDAWLAAPIVATIEPGERYWSILRELLVDAQVAGPLVSDAALAALAIEHGALLVTTDRDFNRFAGLKLLDPLRGKK